MDYYDIWFNLRDSHQHREFCADLDAYLRKLSAHGTIEGYTLRRRKLGFGPPGLGEFNVTIETRDLAQLDEAFQLAATRSDEIEALHKAVYERVKDLSFGLSRDFPDVARENAPATPAVEQQSASGEEFDMDAVGSRRAEKKPGGPPGAQRRKKRRRWPIG
jgi:hypothetical protein